MESTPTKTPIAVYGAIAANIVIAVSKFIAAAVTGSSAMLSEGIHSLVDTGNELLLLLGLKQSQKPEDQDHPFGHGTELYFWSLIVAILLFGIGGGMSIYEGITHLQHAPEKANPIWNYVVLSVAFVSESVSWTIAMREFRTGKRKERFWPAFLSSKDPTVFTVLAEDSAAMVGLLIAFLGVLLGDILKLPAFDGIASILIGAVLAGVAVFLIGQSRGLLIGESADAEVIRRIRELAESDQNVKGVGAILTMYFGPETILLNMDVVFEASLTGSDLAETVDRLEESIRNEFPEVKRIFIETKSVRRIL